MDNIEQLKQDNAKLQERLNNAAKFFRDQKAQIEALTKENKELKRTPKEEVIDTEKWNTLVAEKENLNKQLNEYELKLQASEKTISEQRDAYENKITLLEEDNLKLVEDAKLFDECAKKLSNAEAAYEELRKKYKDNDIARGEAELKASNLQSEYEKIFDKQNKEIKDLNTQVETLKKKFEEEGSNNVANKVLLDEANQTIELKDKAYKVLQDTYNEVFGELNELKETNKQNVNAFEDLNTKFKQLNELYDACENEKLAVENDYANLKEKYEYLKINAEANEEVARKYEEIYEEYENYKQFINILYTQAESLNITWKKPSNKKKVDQNYVPTNSIIDSPVHMA